MIPLFSIYFIPEFFLGYWNGQFYLGLILAYFMKGSDYSRMNQGKLMSLFTLVKLLTELCLILCEWAVDLFQVGSGLMYSVVYSRILNYENGWLYPRLILYEYTVLFQVCLQNCIVWPSFIPDWSALTVQVNHFIPGWSDLIV